MIQILLYKVPLFHTNALTAVLSSFVLILLLCYWVWVIRFCYHFYFHDSQTPFLNGFECDHNHEYLPGCEGDFIEIHMKLCSTPSMVTQPHLQMVMPISSKLRLCFIAPLISCYDFFWTWELFWKLNFCRGLVKKRKKSGAQQQKSPKRIFVLLPGPKILRGACQLPRAHCDLLASLSCHTFRRTPSPSPPPPSSAHFWQLSWDCSCLPFSSSSSEENPH